MDPTVVSEFIRIDHDVWTMREAFMDGLDDSKPGEVTIVFVWDTQAEWDQVGAVEFQQKLQAEFDALFPHPVELIAAPHEDSHFGIHRVTRFERID
jgi:hypothetical protein